MQNKSKFNSDFLRPTEASEALKLSRSKLYEALGRREIPFIKIAGLMRIPRVWIEQQIAIAIASTEQRREDSERER